MLKNTVVNSFAYVKNFVISWICKGINIVTQFLFYLIGKAIHKKHTFQLNLFNDTINVKYGKALFCVLDLYKYGRENSVYCFTPVFPTAFFIITYF